MKHHKQKTGFTLMEMLVATTVFVVVVSSLLALFNYVLRINRKSEALRQASQGMRNLVEFIVKEVRNGQINYGLIDPLATDNSNLPAPCDQIRPGGYLAQSNMLGILDTEGNELCIYYVDDANQPVGAGVFSAPAGRNYGLALTKSSIALTPPQLLNPSNFSVDKLMFLVRPQFDPYASGNPKFQPMVEIVAKFTARLPTGEQVPVYYQTAVSTSKYDIPNSP